MPYIERTDREELHKGTPPRNAGELNYAFSTFVDTYIAENGSSYQTFNDIIGALEGQKLELYRRFIGPYEDKKIVQNGEVYVESKGSSRSITPPESQASKEI